MEFKGDVLTIPESENLVCQLEPVFIDNIGNDSWKRQRKAVELLNMCSHSNTAQNKDDYVKEFLITHEKLSVLLHELLVMEVWRQRVLPSVLNPLAENAAAPYIYCNYESVLVNLFECICFHEEVVLGFGDDILELIDYCWRQVYRLFSVPNVNQCEPDSDPKATLNHTPLENLKKQLDQNIVSRAMACISILWFIVDRINSLPLSVANSILQKNDLPVGIAEILVLQPWLRRSPNKTQKIKNGLFVDVAGDEVQRICIPEAHCWFIIHKLLCDKDCRTQYHYTVHRKEIILRIKRFINNVLIDQIPPLESVQRALEELSFLEPPSGTEEKFKSTLVIEQVPRLLSSIDTRNKDWKSATTRMINLLTDSAAKMNDAVWLSEIFSLMYT